MPRVRDLAVREPLRVKVGVAVGAAGAAVVARVPRPTLAADVAEVHGADGADHVVAAAVPLHGGVAARALLRVLLDPVLREPLGGALEADPGLCCD